MSVRVLKLTLWRTEVDNRPGALAEMLDPLAAAGVDLQVVMGYRRPDAPSRSVVEVAPATGRKATLAAEKAHLRPGGAATLLVVGDNRPGLVHRVASALADSNVNVAFLLAQVVGRRYSAVFGFDSEADLDRAADRIRAAAVARPLAMPVAPRTARRAAARQPTRTRARDAPRRRAAR